MVKWYVILRDDGIKKARHLTISGKHKNNSCRRVEEVLPLSEGKLSNRGANNSIADTENKRYTPEPLGVIYRGDWIQGRGEIPPLIYKCDLELVYASNYTETDVVGCTC